MKGLNLIKDLGFMFLTTVQDVAPIILLIAFYQIMVIKKPIPDLPRVFMGFVFVIIGLALFLLGLEKALFPIGDIMARQLSDPDFINNDPEKQVRWYSYYWIYLFAAFIGFATTIAEPSLKAVAIKAKSVSGGAMGEWTLRITVAVGAGLALALGAYRIIVGTPLYYYLIFCYCLVLVQTIFVPKKMVALAYDSGGVTTSTVTVPIVAALGLGLSSVVPGSNPALDGFGMIALVCMFPIITVLGYIQLIEIIKRTTKTKST